MLVLLLSSLPFYKIVGKWRIERLMKKQYTHGACKLYKISIKIGITRHTESSKSLAYLGLTGIKLGKCLFTLQRKEQSKGQVENAAHIMLKSVSKKQCICRDLIFKNFLSSKNRNLF